MVFVEIHSIGFGYCWDLVLWCGEWRDERRGRLGIEVLEMGTIGGGNDIV